jgi:hypothetical protein
VGRLVPVEVHRPHTSSVGRIFSDSHASGHCHSVEHPNVDAHTDTDADGHSNGDKHANGVAHCDAHNDTHRHPDVD